MQDFESIFNDQVACNLNYWELNDASNVSTSVCGRITDVTDSGYSFSPTTQSKSARAPSKHSQPLASKGVPPQQGNPNGTMITLNSGRLCSICGQTFSVPKSLRRHMGTVHLDEVSISKTNKIQCSVCFRHFSRKDTLSRHEKYQHNRSKVHCLVCGKFVAGRALQEHLRSRACETFQALEDAKQVEAFKLSVAIITSDTLLDPLIASQWLFYYYVNAHREEIAPQLVMQHIQALRSQQDIPSLKEEWEDLCPTYWRLRGLTMRATKRALSDSVQAASCELAGALCTMSWLEGLLSLHAGTIVYTEIARSLWTYERYQKEVDKIEAIIVSAFSGLNLNQTSPCCGRIGSSMPVRSFASTVCAYGTGLTM